MKRKIFGFWFLLIVTMSTYGAYTAANSVVIREAVSSFMKEYFWVANPDLDGVIIEPVGYRIGDPNIKSEPKVIAINDNDYYVETNEPTLGIDYTVPGKHLITASIYSWYGEGTVLREIEYYKYIFDTNFLPIEDILDTFEEKSSYVYDGEVKGVKRVAGWETDTSFSVYPTYDIASGTRAALDRNVSSNKRIYDLYYKGADTNNEEVYIGYGTFEVEITVNDAVITYPSKLLFTDQLPYTHKVTITGNLTETGLFNAGGVEFRYNGPKVRPGTFPIVTGGEQQSVATFVVSGSHDILNVEIITSKVSVISKMEPVEVGYDGENHFDRAKAVAEGINLQPGVGVTHTYKNSAGDEVTEMIERGVYTIEAVYTYVGADSIMDETTYTIIEGEIDRKEIIDDSQVYTGSPITLTFDVSELPEGVTVVPGSPISVTGTEPGTYEITIPVLGGDNYNNAEIILRLIIGKKKHNVVPQERTEDYTGTEYDIIFDDTVLPPGTVLDPDPNTETEVRGTDAGVYTVNVKVKGGDYYDDFEIPLILTINKIDITGVTFDDKTVEYDGNVQRIEIAGTLPSGASETYDQNEYTDVGVYNVVATILGGQNYNNLELNAVLTITEKPYSLPDQVGNTTYDGTEHTFTFDESLLPPGAKVKDGTPKEIKVTDAGEYELIVQIDGGTNYQDFEVVMKYTVDKATYTPTPQEHTMSFIEGGQSVSVDLTDVPDGATIESIDSVSGTDVGTYTTTVQFKGGPNYEDFAIEMILNIVKADILNVEFEDKTVEYNGANQTILITGTLPAGTSVTYEENDKMDPGVYNAVALISGGQNYKDLRLEAVFTITQLVFVADDQISRVVYNATEQEFAYIASELPSGVTVKDVNTVSVSGTDAGTYEKIIAFDGGVIYQDFDLKLILIIDKATHVADPQEYTFTYNEQEHAVSVDLLQLPAGVSVDSSSINELKATDAGVYRHTVQIDGGNNYENFTVELVLTIDKATYAAAPQNHTRTFVEEGIEVALDLTQLPNGVSVQTGSESSVSGRNVGTYSNTIEIDGGNNYENFTVELNLEITKADVPVTFEDKTVEYKFVAQSIEITGTLPDGVTVRYENNSYMNPGVYDAIAYISGGQNYNDVTLRAVLTITRVTHTPVDQVHRVTYNGEIQTFEYRANEIPLIAEVYPNSPTSVSGKDVGEYTANVDFYGREIFNDFTIKLILIIEKATYNSTPQKQELVYNTLEQTATFDPTLLPEGAFVKPNATTVVKGTDVGSYSVTVEIDGGKNYEDFTVELTLDITKADITGVTFDDKTEVYNGSEYKIEVTGNVPDGASVVYENNTHTNAGTYNAVAKIAGGQNYNDLTLDAKLIINKAVFIPNPAEQTGDTVYDGSEQTLVFDESTLPPGASVKPGTPFEIKATDAGTYTLDVEIIGGNNYENFTVRMTYTIAKAPYVATTQHKTVTYVEAGHTLELDKSLLPEGLDSTTGGVTSVSGVDVDRYEARITIDEGKNYLAYDVMLLLIIEKADITSVPGVELVQEYELVYNTLEQIATLDSALLPAGTFVDAGVNTEVKGTNVDTYSKMVAIKGGKNYKDFEVEVILKIVKADITGVTFDDKTEVYNGSEYKIEVTGNIPDGASVVYENNTHTNAGTYNAVAKIAGGQNYNDLTLDAKLIINKAVFIPNPAEQTGDTVYNGNEQTLVFDDSTLPPGATVKPGTPFEIKATDAGTYTLDVEIIGGNNYENFTVRMTYTIAKAPYVAATQHKTVTYVEAGHTLELDKSLLPEGLDSTPGGVTSISGVDVDRYEVRITIDEGKNYLEYDVMLLLIIEKADIMNVTFEDKTVDYDGNSHDIEVTGTLPTGTSVTYEESTQTDVGVYNAVAKIAGGRNYNDLELHAVFTILDPRVPSSEAEIFEFKINGVSIPNPGEVTEFMLDPDPNSNTEIEVVSRSDYSTIDKPEIFDVDTREPKVYYIDVVVTSEDGTVSRKYTLKLIKPIEEKMVVLQKFQNTLAINNNPGSNGGYEFVSYQWFRNGQLVSAKQSYSVGQKEQNKLNPNDDYYAILQTKSGDEIYTTRIDIYKEPNKEIKLYPNPVSVNDMTTTIRVEYDPSEFESGRVDILTVDGRFVYSQVLTIGENRIVIPNQVSTGIYLAVVDINGRKQTIRFTIK